MSKDLWTSVDRYLSERVIAADEALENALATSAKAGLPEIAVSPTPGMSSCTCWRRHSAPGRSSRLARSAATAPSGWRALAPGGSLITLEADPKHADIARANIGHSGAVAARAGSRRRRARHLAAARRRREGSVRLRVHRRRQNQHRCLLHVGDESLPAGWAHRRRQRRARRAVADAATTDTAVQGMRRFFDLVRFVRAST